MHVRGTFIYMYMLGIRKVEYYSTLFCEYLLIDPLFL